MKTADEIYEEVALPAGLAFAGMPLREIAVLWLLRCGNEEAWLERREEEGAEMEAAVNALKEMGVLRILPGGAEVELTATLALVVAERGAV